MGLDGESPVRAVVATNRLVDWGGSEVVALEMAEALAGRGLQVTLFTYVIREAQAAEASRLGIPVETDATRIDLRDVDILYSHHHVASALYAAQIERDALGDAAPVIVYNHLSPYEPLEAPGVVLEPELADLIWCNSEETRRELSRFGPRFAAAEVVPNPAPSRFFESRSEPGDRLSRLLLVSNHVPAEVAEAVDILRAQGVTVTWIGLAGERRRLTPADIAQHDALLCIGKSTQYAFACGTPVYCYDRFGGPGWIGPGSIDDAAAWNFSGRDDPRRLDAATLTTELTAGYVAARDFAQTLDPARLDVWRLDHHVERLLHAATGLAADPVRRARVRQVRDSAAFRDRLRAEGRWQAAFRTEMLARLGTEEYAESWRRRAEKLDQRRLYKRIGRLLQGAA